MFYHLILENETGQQINLSRTANRFMFSKIEGLNPPAGTVSTSSYAGMDGSYLNNAFIEKRNVVIPFEMRGFDVEKRRHELYQVKARNLLNPAHKLSRKADDNGREIVLSDYKKGISISLGVSCTF